jgi:uncharacterized protein YlxW (UPF0749 family)
MLDPMPDPPPHQSDEQRHLDEPDRPRVAPGGATGRDRLLRALRRPSRGQAIVGVLLVVLGYAAVTQVRFTQVDNTYAGLREQDLIDVLSGLAGTSQRAETEIARLRQTRDDLRSSTTSREAALAQAQQQTETLAVLAGLVPVTGPGIRLTVTEQDQPVDVQDFVDTFQELRTAGAEAIQVNGQVRVVANTAVEDATGGLLVGGQLVTSPYVIDVIGEPHTLAASGINFPDGPRELFEKDGAEVKVDELSSVDIQSVVKLPQTELASPAAGQ